MASAAILNFEAKMILKLYDLYFIGFVMPEIVENDTLFVFLAQLLPEKLDFLYFGNTADFDWRNIDVTFSHIGKPENTTTASINWQGCCEYFCIIQSIYCVHGRIYKKFSEVTVDFLAFLSLRMRNGFSLITQVIIVIEIL